MTLNPDLVRERCQEITDSLARLARFQEIPRDEFLEDQDSLDIACYRLLVAIEAALGLCFHVSAKRLETVPADYAACFGKLGEAGLIPEDLAVRLQRMARFRNLLIHVYWEVDYEKVREIIDNNLDDLREFRGAMAGLLQPTETLDPPQESSVE